MHLYACIYFFQLFFSAPLYFLPSHSFGTVLCLNTSCLKQFKQECLWRPLWIQNVGTRLTTHVISFPALMLSYQLNNPFWFLRIIVFSALNKLECVCLLITSQSYIDLYFEILARSPCFVSLPVTVRPWHNKPEASWPLLTDHHQSWIMLVGGIPFPERTWRNW